MGEKNKKETEEEGGRKTFDDYLFPPSSQNSMELPSTQAMIF